MIKARTLILSSAAGLMAMSGAQAADLPVKAKAVEYVRICSLYGAGFFYIPGTDTCIKIGGYLRADTTFNGGAHGAPAWNGDLGQQNRFRDYFVSRSRLALTVDTRTATEYGVVRTFGQGDFQFNNFGNSNPTTLTAFPGGSCERADTSPAAATSRLNISSSSSPASPSVSLRRPTRRPGTASRATSTRACSAATIPTPASTTSSTPPSSATACRPRIGLDDPTVWNRTSRLQSEHPRRDRRQRHRIERLCRHPCSGHRGKIRVDQAWGLFQLSAAAHEVNGFVQHAGRPARVPTNLSEISGHPETKWGGSVMAALQIKNLPTGPGDDIKFDVSYAKGATKHVIATSGTSPSFAMFGGSGFGYQSVGFGATTDGVYLPGAGGTGGIVLTSAWGIRGAFNHNWDPYWSSSLFGSYSSVRYDGGANDNLLGAGTTSAKGAYCAAFAASHPGQALVGSAAGAYTCNPDFNVSQLGVVTRWTPVKNLTFTAEVQWFHLDQKMSGSSVFTATAPKPNALYEFKDQDTVPAAGSRPAQLLTVILGRCGRSRIALGKRIQIIASAIRGRLEQA